MPRLLPRRGSERSAAYEGLMAAQQCLPNNDVRDKFAAEYSVLGTIWKHYPPIRYSVPTRKITAG